MGFPQYRRSVSGEGYNASIYRGYKGLIEALDSKDTDAAFAEMQHYAADVLRKRDKDLGVYPYNSTLASQLPAVDPAGKFCEQDALFAERMARIDAVAPTRSRQTEAYLERARADMAHWMERSQGVLEQLRLYECMATLTSDEALYGKIKREYDALVAQSPELSAVNSILGAMEYAAVISPKKPSVTQLEGGHDETLRIPQGVLQERAFPSAPNPELSVELDFEKLVSLQNMRLISPRYASDIPNKKEKLPIDLDENAEEANKTLVKQYSNAAVSRLLDPYFARAEASTTMLPRHGIGGVNRGDLIIVNGRTVREIMAELFAQTGSDMAQFEEHYRKNVRTAASDLVAAALKKGQRVEMFPPNKDGRVNTDHPTVLTRAGGEQKDRTLKPVTFNSVHRFFNRYFGLFKERATQAEEYRAFQEARRRVALRNDCQCKELCRGASQVQKDMFFRTWQAKNGALPTAVPHGLSVDRTLLHSFAVYRLAAVRGCPIEEIMDPTKRVEEKQRIGEEVVERLKAGDMRWICETLVKGAASVNKQIERMRDPNDGAYVDITDPAQLRTRKGQALTFAANAAFDLFQDATKKNAIRDAVAAYAAQQDEYAAEVQALGAKAFVDKHIGAQEHIAAYLSLMENNTLAQLELCSEGMLGVVKNKDGAVADRIGKVAQAKFATDLYKKAIENAPPGAPPPSVHFAEFLGANARFPHDSAVRAMAKKMEQDPDFAATAASKILSGEFQSGIEGRNVHSERGTVVDYQVKIPKVDTIAPPQVEKKEPAQTMGRR